MSETNPKLYKPLDGVVFQDNEVDIKGANRVLCNYCLRTSSNGNRCIGRCVEDSEY